MCEILEMWKRNHEKKSLLKFSISFQIVKKNIFSTLCYNNDENCDLFKL
jgi:hypothetical protein